MGWKRTVIMAGAAAALVLAVSFARCQIVGLEPTPFAVYYWDATSSSFLPCTTASALEPNANTPQAVVLNGYNSGLGQWTPNTSCPGSGGGGTPGGTNGQIQYNNNGAFGGISVLTVSNGGLGTNAAPTAGQVPVGQSGGYYAPESLTFVTTAPAGSQIISQPILNSYTKPSEFCATNEAGVFYVDCFPSGSIGGLQLWSSSTAYVSGNQVIYLGNAYQATASNTNADPVDNPSDWTGITNPYTWSSGIAYPQYAAVSYGGTSWIAVQACAAGTTPGTNQTCWYSPTFNLDTASSTAWSSSTSYVKYSLVSFGGVIYSASVPNKNEEPDTNPFFWSVAAVVYANGVSGTQITKVYPWTPTQFTGTGLAFYGGCVPANVDVAQAVAGAGLNDQTNLFNSNEVLRFGPNSQANHYSTCGGLFVPQGSGQAVNYIGYGTDGVNGATAIYQEAPLNYAMVYKGDPNFNVTQQSIIFSGFYLYGANYASACMSIGGAQGTLIRNNYCAGGYTDYGGESSVATFSPNDFSTSSTYETDVSNNKFTGSLSSTEGTPASLTANVSGGVIGSYTVNSGGAGYRFARCAATGGSGFSVGDTFEPTESGASGMVCTVTRVGTGGSITGSSDTSCNATCAATFTTQMQIPLTVLTGSGSATGALVNLQMMLPFVFNYTTGNEACGVEPTGLLAAVSSGAITGVTVGSGGSGCAAGASIAVSVQNNSGFTYAMDFGIWTDDDVNQDVIQGNFYTGAIFTAQPLRVRALHVYSGGHIAAQSNGGNSFIDLEADTIEHIGLLSNGEGDNLNGIEWEGNGSYVNGIAFALTPSATDARFTGTISCYPKGGTTHSFWTAMAIPQPNGYGSIANGVQGTGQNVHFDAKGTCDTTSWPERAEIEISNNGSNAGNRPQHWMNVPGSSNTNPVLGSGGGLMGALVGSGYSSPMLDLQVYRQGAFNDSIFTVSATGVYVGSLGTATSGSTIFNSAPLELFYNWYNSGTAQASAITLQSTTLSNTLAAGPILNITFPNIAGLTGQDNLDLINPIPATSGLNQAAPLIYMAGNYWNGSASTGGAWAFIPQVGIGANPQSMMNVEWFAGGGTGTGIWNFYNASTVNFGPVVPAATSSNNYPGEPISFTQVYYNSGSLNDVWTLTPTIASSGSSPLTELTVTHSGSAGATLFAVQSPVSVNSGSNVVYRCATAGATLGVGDLTITAAHCGSTADTGLRVN